jgi:hypothetical protein
MMKKHFVWILFWFSTCGLAHAQPGSVNPPPAQNHPCAVRSIGGQNPNSILIAAGYKDVLVSISRDVRLGNISGMGENTGTLTINWGDSQATLGTARDRNSDMYYGDKWFITARWINAVVKAGTGPAIIEYCIITTAG